jgi:hypothetical protein
MSRQAGESFSTLKAKGFDGWDFACLNKRRRSLWCYARAYHPAIPAGDKRQHAPGIFIPIPRQKPPAAFGGKSETLDPVVKRGTGASCVTPHRLRKWSVGVRHDAPE